MVEDRQQAWRQNLNGSDDGMDDGIAAFVDCAHRLQF
jgi:hypothetical protein